MLESPVELFRVAVVAVVLAETFDWVPRVVCPVDSIWALFVQHVLFSLLYAQ